LRQKGWLYHDCQKQDGWLVPAGGIQNTTGVENPPTIHLIGGSVRPGFFFRVGHQKLTHRGLIGPPDNGRNTDFWIRFVGIISLVFEKFDILPKMRGRTLIFKALGLTKEN
jgi:hypothetical protein